jgi:hypothetical protein
MDAESLDVENNAPVVIRFVHNCPWFYNKIISYLDLAEVSRKKGRCLARVSLYCCIETLPASIEIKPVSTGLIAATIRYLH